MTNNRLGGKESGSIPVAAARIGKVSGHASWVGWMRCAYPPYKLIQL